MRVVITGALGFIGQKISEAVIGLESSLAVRGTCLDLTLVDFWRDLIPLYEKLGFPCRRNVYNIVSKARRIYDPHDFIVDYEKVAPDLIIHAGAVVDTENLGDKTLWDRNVGFIETMVEKVNINKSGDRGTSIVFLSSASVYGTEGFPNNPYGLSKAVGENIVRESSGRVSILRLFNVFGTDEHHKGSMVSLPWKLARAYQTHSICELHSPEAKRDFIPVDSVARIAAQYVMNGGPSEDREIWDVGTGVATTLDDLDAKIASATGSTQRMTKIIKMPERYVGRYQGFTQAGMRGIPVHPLASGISTDEGIEKYYGKR